MVTKSIDRQRKWKLILLSMSMLVLGFALVSTVPALGPFFSTFSSTLIALNVVYGGANVASKFVLEKNKKLKE